MENILTVSDLIQSEYTRWSTEKPIIICAPTGSGKTHFILNTLLPFAKAQGRKICYMSNRKVLKAQVEQKIPVELSEHIIIKNYQEGSFDNASDYWVLDESHYFLADTSFNVQINALASLLSENYAKHICIFMTATPEYLFLFLARIFGKVTLLPEPYFLNENSDTIDHDPSQFQSATALLQYKEIYPKELENYYDVEQLQRYRKNYFSRQIDNYYSVFRWVKDSCQVYEFPPDYSYIDPCYFCNDDDLTQLVKASPDDEKWMIFVSAKDDGRNLQMRLIKAGIHDTAYLDALHKDPEGKIARKHIISEEQFPNRVLICTKVVDNGISISDPSVKHIVIFRTDKTTFLQMLGRKRIDRQSHERITLYLKYESYKGMQKYFNQKVLDIIKFLRLFKHQKSSHTDSSDPGREPTTFKSAGYLGQRFVHEGHFDPHYKNYLIRSYPSFIKYSIKHMANSNLSDDNMRDRLPLEFFRINDAGKRKLTYEYYQLMAMFERHENRLLEQPDADDTIWLEEQLSWIGKTYDPSRWDSVISGKQPYARRQVEEFLEAHLGVLTRENRDIFARLIADYAKTVRPYLKEINSSFSFKIVQRILEKCKFPYVLSKERKSLNGKDAYWWIVERKPENNNP